MPVAPQLVLVVPDLLAWADRAAPRPGAPGTPRPRAAALARLIAQAGAPARGPGDVAAALAALYGVARQDDWPLAPIRLAALGVDPGRDYWIAADPVTLVAGRDDVGLGGRVTDFDRAEADAIVAALNAHFAADGIAFAAPRPDAMFARVATPPRLVTPSLAAAARRPLSTLLPHGADAPTWLRWQSEIQMLLHGLPVNVERERDGRACANSLWFSGGGTLPVRPSRVPAIRTYATDVTAVALAAFAGAPAVALPADCEAAIADAALAETIVAVVDPPTEAASLERGWGAPAWRALASGRLASVAIVADDAGDAVTWMARRPRFRQRLASRMARLELSTLLGAARRGG